MESNMTPFFVSPLGDVTMIIFNRYFFHGYSYMSCKSSLALSNAVPTLQFSVSV